jgi:glycosyltransferase involved in cell wall biosynthesis
MKIAIVARHASPTAHSLDFYSADQSDQADLADHVNGLGRALAAQGHQVVIYARKDSANLPGKQAIAPRLTAEFVTIGPVAPLPADELATYAKDLAAHLARSWRKNAPDVVHALGWTNGLAVLAATREVPTPVVVTFGSLGSAERRCRLGGEVSAPRLKLEPAIARAATCVLATSEEEAEELSRLGVPGRNLACVPTGVNLKTFKPAGYRVKRNKQPRLLAVGSFAEHRRLDLLLRCLPELPGAELVIAGGPPANELESDQGYRLLAKLAAHLGVTERVQFTGRVSESELAALLRSTDLLVSVARYEPQAGPAISAMACGVPVIATSVGGYRDAVIDGTSGVLVPPERPAAIARHLRDLLASPMRMAAYGIAGADRARSRYSWERVAAETVAAYDRAIGRTPSAEASVLPLAVRRQATSELQAAA